MSEKQAEALRLAELLDGGDRRSGDAAIAAELRRLHAKVAELEAQLEAIGAGGVGPLMAPFRSPGIQDSSSHLEQRPGMVKLRVAVVKEALDALEYHRDQTRPIQRTAEAIISLSKALATEQKAETGAA